jgi:hypothetical protein
MERAYRMFSAEQHRTKAAEFRALLMNIPRSPNETRELRSLEQTYTTLAENEEWMAVNLDKRFSGDGITPTVAGLRIICRSNSMARLVLVVGAV